MPDETFNQFFKRVETTNTQNKMIVSPIAQTGTVGVGMRQPSSTHWGNTIAKVAIVSSIYITVPSTSTPIVNVSAPNTLGSPQLVLNDSLVPVRHRFTIRKRMKRVDQKSQEIPHSDKFDSSISDTAYVKLDAVDMNQKGNEVSGMELIDTIRKIQSTIENTTISISAFVIAILLFLFFVSGILSLDVLIMGSYMGVITIALMFLIRFLRRRVDG